MRHRRTSNEVYQNLVEAVERDYLAITRLLRTVDDKQVVRVLENFKRGIYENQKLIDELYQIAITDELTGFKTRGYLESVLMDKLQKETRLGYLLIDIDHFKQYNDTFGHRQGDTALEQVAETISQYADSDRIVRYGGEEFALFIVRYSQKRRLHQKGEEIRRAVERLIIPAFSPTRITTKILQKLHSTNHKEDTASLRPHIESFFREKDFAQNYERALSSYFGNSAAATYIRQLQRRTVSIGGSQRQRGESLIELMDRADDALYIAKKERNRVIVA